MKEITRCLWSAAVAIWIVLLTRLACACVCPVLWPECQDRDVFRDLQAVAGEAGECNLTPPTDVEWQAIEAVVYGGRMARTPVDLHRQDCGAMGWAHWQPPDPWSVGIEAKRECAYQDPEWRDWTMALMYSDWSGPLSLMAWRERTSLVRSMSRRAGWHDDNIAMALAMANSTGQRGFIEMAEQCAWKVPCVVLEYVGDSAHRRRRINYHRRAR